MNWTEIRDQSAHAAIVALALVPFALSRNPLTGLFAGFVIGMVAEVKERGNPVTAAKVRSALKSRRDLTFYSLTGATIGLACLVAAQLA